MSGKVSNSPTATAAPTRIPAMAKAGASVGSSAGHGGGDHARQGTGQVRGAGIGVAQRTLEAHRKRHKVSCCQPSGRAPSATHQAA